MSSLFPLRHVAVILLGLVILGYGLVGFHRDLQFKGPVGHAMGTSDRQVMSFTRSIGSSIHYNYTVGQRNYTNPLGLIDSDISLYRLRLVQTVPVRYLVNSPGISRLDFPGVDQSYLAQHIKIILFGSAFLVGGFLAWRRQREGNFPR